VLRLITVRQREAAVELARRYQLVTPVSGAVVLETRAQFEQAGLQAVDSNSVPSVPEPGVIILLLAGAGILGLRFALRRRARGNPAVEPPVAAGVQ
jgi:hypothetical protein